MALIKISSFSMYRIRSRSCEIVAILIVCVWFLSALIKESQYSNADDVNRSFRIFFTDPGNDFKRNFTCYNEDDPYSKKLFPDKLLKERGCEQQLPQVLVAGVKYCRTDILTSLLRHHPYIVFPKTVDVSYFSEFYDLGINWYKKQMGFSIKSQLTADSSPSYFTDTNTPHRVRSELSNGTKIIVLFCDPVVRALREMTESNRAQDELLDDMNVEAPGPEADDLYETWKLDSPVVINSSNGIIARGIFIKYLSEWYKHFPEKNIFMVGEERLFNDTDNVLAKLETFLNLPTYFSSKVFRDPFQNFICVSGNVKYDPFCFSRNYSLIEEDTREFQNLRKFYKPYNDKLQKMFLVPVL